MTTHVAPPGELTGAGGTAPLGRTPVRGRHAAGRGRTVLLVALVAAAASVTGLLVVDPAPGTEPSTATSGVAGGTTSAPDTSSTPATTSADAPADAATATGGPPGSGRTWTQVFGDEFDGTEIDSTKWWVNRYGGTSDDGAFNPSYEGAFYSPDNVGESDGSAWLEIRPEARSVEGVDYTHSTGMLSSEGSFQLQDGDYVEARVWIPEGDGLWPAFWTVPNDRWPPEIDIFEVFDTAAANPPVFIYHYPGTVGVDGELTVEEYGAAGVDYRNSWHTFGMLRSEGRIVPYVDGVAHPEAGVAAGADALPQSIILNMAMYADRNPTAGTRMLIDWLRVWRPATG